MCATWWRECHAYSSVAASTVIGPICACLKPRSHSSALSDSSTRTQRACSPSSRSSDSPTGAVAESTSIAHAFSSYGDTAGQSSVSARRTRINAFMWLSATW